MDDIRHALTAVFWITVDTGPSALAHRGVSFFESVRRAHDTIFQHTALLIADLIDGKQDFRSDFSCFFKDCARHVVGQVGVTFDIGTLMDSQNFMQNEHDVFGGCLKNRHGFSILLKSQSTNAAAFSLALVSRPISFEPDLIDPADQQCLLQVLRVGGASRPNVARRFRSSGSTE